MTTETLQFLLDILNRQQVAIGVENFEELATLAINAKKELLDELDGRERV